MATTTQQTIHSTMLALQAQLNNSIHNTKLMKKPRKRITIEELQRDMKPIHPDKH